MNNRFAVINFSPNLNIRRRTIKLRQLKAMFTFTTLRLHLHTIEYRMPLRGEFRLEIFQFPYWLSNPKFRPPALSFGAQKKFRSESLTVAVDWLLHLNGFTNPLRQYQRLLHLYLDDDVPKISKFCLAQTSDFQTSITLKRLKISKSFFHILKI